MRSWENRDRIMTWEPLRALGATAHNRGINDWGVQLLLIAWHQDKWRCEKSDLTLGVDMVACAIVTVHTFVGLKQ
jgi:hypothetical protein